MSAIADLVDDRCGIYRPTGHVDGVFEADERRLRAVIDLGTDRRGNGAPRQHAVLTIDDAGKYACERCERPHLVVVDVAVCLAYDFLARPRLSHDAGEVAHRPRRNE